MEHEMGILVRQMKLGRLRQPVIKIGIAVTASALLSAGAASLISSRRRARWRFHTSRWRRSTRPTRQSGSPTPTSVVHVTGRDRRPLSTRCRPWESRTSGSGLLGRRRALPRLLQLGSGDYIVNAANERDMGVLGVINSTPAMGQPDWRAGGTARQRPQSVRASSPARWRSATPGRSRPTRSGTSRTPRPSEPGRPIRPDTRSCFKPLIRRSRPPTRTPPSSAAWSAGSPTIDESRDQPCASTSQQMYAAGAQGYFDALSFHPYQYTIAVHPGRRWPSSTRRSISSADAPGPWSPTVTAAS